MKNLECSKKVAQKADKGLEQGTVVIVVDMQKELVDNLREGESDRIIPNQLAVLRHCRKFNIPVVVLEFGEKRFGKTIKILISEAQKNPRFNKIIKMYDDGFAETGLDYHLKSLGAKKIFFMGINADFCVRSTANSAIKNGYQVITSNEVISGQDHHRHDNNIPWFSANGTCISSISKLIG